MMAWMQTILERVLSLRRRFIGLIIGCVVWILWQLFGFWSMILLLVLASLGYAIGRILEEQQNWKQVLEKLVSERFGDS